MHTAGITLMRGDPRLVADALSISGATYRKIRQNLFWALIYNLIAIPLAASGALKSGSLPEPHGDVIGECGNQLSTAAALAAWLSG